MPVIRAPIAIARFFAFAFAITFALAAPVTSAAAGPTETRACVADADEGQRDRDRHALVSARGHFVRCTDATCPSAVRRACDEWLRDVEARTPSVVVRVRDGAGRDVVDARVRIDGGEAFRVDGAARSLDPGEHTFVAEGASGAAEARIVLAEGERGRLVDLQVPSATRVAEPPRRAAATAKDASGRSWAAPIALGAAGVAALGVATYLTWSARSDAAALRATCAPGCDPSQVDSLRARAHAADVALAVGVGALGAAAIVVWLGAPRAGASTVAITVAPRPDGAAAGARVTF